MAVTRVAKLENIQIRVKAMPLLANKKNLELRLDSNISNRFSPYSDFSSIEQIGNHLCWAACIKSIFNTYEYQNVSQKQLADKYIEGCETAYQVDTEIWLLHCNVKIDPQSYVDAWQDVGFANAKIIDDTQQFISIIQAELLSKRPVCAAALGGRHSVVIYGYRELDTGEEQILVMDPQFDIEDKWYSVTSYASTNALFYRLGI